MKRLVSLVLSAFVFSASFINSAFAEEPEITVFINGEKIEFDVSPMLINDRTMVPMRAVFEKLGAEVIWNGDENTVRAYNNEKSVLLTIGSSYMETDEDIIKLDAPAIIHNERTLIPLRAVTESFMCNVSWDGNTRSVNVYTPDFAYMMQETVEVATPSELIESIGSNKRIVLTADYYNLSDVILSLTPIENTHINNFEAKAFGNIVVENVSNMTITGDAEIVIENIYSDVLTFRDCENITLSGLKIGHLEPLEEYSCEGAVLNLENCSGVTVEKCSLYGCGAVGLQTSGVTELNINECKIYDCSYTGVWLTNGTKASVKNTEFYDSLTLSGFIRVDNSNIVCENSKIHNITAPIGEDAPGFVDTFDLDGTPSVIHFIGCEFKDNKFEKITNSETVNLVFEKCTFDNNIGSVDTSNAFFIN